MTNLWIVSVFSLQFVLFSSVDAKPSPYHYFKSSEHSTSCGYDSCHPLTEDVINVHLVPHTHDDVGWLKTVDQYYYGHRNNIQKAGVQYILDSVVDELIKNPDRRFVYVESAFFEKWWSKQDDQRRHHVKRLVSEGRLEFAGGAWSMNDEATTHYQSVLDQLTWGLRFLNDTFGECGRPKVGWQIDPFGHSREFANMLALSGFDGLLLGRIDYQDRIQRSLSKHLEMVWRGSDDSGVESDILTGIMYNTYSPPPGFCFDVLCSDEPVIDDVNSPDYNVPQLVEKFTAYIRKMTKVYQTNNVIVTMGGDFTYQDALMWYKNMDKLIAYVNGNKTDIKLIYSTPSCYIKSLLDSNATWPVKQDDFFPYSSDEHAFWTGYFTSRPTIKYFERRGNNFLQVCKQLYTMTTLNEREKNDLNMLRTAMGIMQHHDAITGTEKQHVAKDYARILNEGIQDCLIVVQDALNKLMKVDEHSFYLPIELCHLNMSECSITEKSNKFVVIVYNPLAHTLSNYVRLPITGKAYDVTNAFGKKVETQLTKISDNVLNQLRNRKSNATQELIFYAENIPALGFTSYFVEKSSQSHHNEKRFGRKTERNDDDGDHQSPISINSNRKSESMSIGNDYIKVSIDENTGYIGTVTYTKNNTTTTIPIKQEILFYEGMAGNNSESKNRASGAYIFRPSSQKPKLITTKPENYIVKGIFVEEIHQRFSDWASQIIRVYRTEEHIEFEWLIGPIPVEDKIGKEVISRFSTNFKTDDTFYTDSNGRQMLKRILNKRPTWDAKLFEPTSGNYYPVTSTISIKDIASKKELFVLTDRSQGGTSLEDGQIELMVHRRLLHDDAFGVEEALNETENGVGLIARGTHLLVVGDYDENISSTVYSRILALKKLLEPTILVSPANNMTLAQWLTNNNMFKGIATSLPPNIHLLTLEPWKGKSILLRLEHFIQKNEDPSRLSEPITVDLENLFTKLKITSLKETTLTGNQLKEDLKHRKLRTNEEMENNFNDAYNSYPKYSPSVTMITNSESVSKHTRTFKKRENNYFVTLKAMEIKTFIIEIELK